MKLSFVTALAVCTVGAATLSCGKVDPPTGDAAVTPPVVVGEHTVIMPREVEFDALRPFALSLDPTKTSVMLTEADLSGPNPRLVGNVVEQLVCGPRQPSSAGLEKLARLGHAKVRSIDIQLVYEPDIDGKPSLRDAQYACFGVRRMDGTWTWDTRQVEVKFDETIQRLRVRFELPGDVAIDAIKIIADGPRLSFRPVEKVTYDVVGGP